MGYHRLSKPDAATDSSTRHTPERPLAPPVETPPSLLSLWMETSEGSRFRPLAVGSSGRCCSWLARARRRGVEARLGRAFKQTDALVQFQFPAELGWFWLGKFSCFGSPRRHLFLYLSTAYIGSANFSGPGAAGARGVSMDLVPCFRGFGPRRMAPSSLLHDGQPVAIRKTRESAVHPDACPGSVYRKHSGLWLGRITRTLRIEGVSEEKSAHSSSHSHLGLAIALRFYQLALKISRTTKT